MKKIHILNGDSTLSQFNKTDIEGDTFVWKEILCEGETKLDLNSEEFWETRLQFFEKFFIDFNPVKYNQLKEKFLKINLSKYKEIILWFEYDLFCQINLIAILSWLYNIKLIHEISISLICLGEHPNYQDLVGLGEIKLKEFEKLYPRRIRLQSEDLDFADKIWKIYCSDRHEDLITEIDIFQKSTLKYLKKAIIKHQNRFPNKENGLTEIESRIINSIIEESKSKPEIVGQMLRRQEYYGFGDLQYFKFIEDLAPILEEKEGNLKVNELGLKVIEHKLDFNNMRKKVDRFGGVKMNQYRWDRKEKKLIKETGP